MEELKRIICRELEEIAEKGELSAGELDTVYKLIVAKEKLLRIEEIEDSMGGYSRSGEWRANGNYNRDYSGKHYVRAHYSRGDRRYSMDEGRAHLSEQLKDMIDSSDFTSAQKSALRKAMEALQE